MADKIFVTRAQLDAIAAGLSKLKKKEDERFTFKAGVGLISPVITDFLAKGFSYPDLSAILLRDHNIDIKPATLATYHRAAVNSNGSAAKQAGSDGCNQTTAAPGDASNSANRATLPLDKPGAGGGKFIKDPDI